MFEVEQVTTQTPVSEMSEQELKQEKNRLARSQGGNPNEEKWRPEMINRFNEVAMRLKTIEAKKEIGDNTDIADMQLPELLDKQVRLGKEQSRNPQGVWDHGAKTRLELIEEKIKILDPNELRKN